MPRPQPVKFVGYLHDILGVPATVVQETWAVFQNNNRDLFAMKIEAKPTQVDQRAFFSALIAGEVEELSGVSVSLSVEDLVNKPRETLAKKINRTYADIFKEYSDFGEKRRGQQAAILVRDQITREDADKVLTPDSIIMRYVNRVLTTSDDGQYVGMPLERGTPDEPVKSKMTLIKWSDEDGEYIDRYYKENNLDTRVRTPKPYQDIASNFKSLASETRRAGGRVNQEIGVNEGLAKAWAAETFGVKEFDQMFNGAKGERLWDVLNNSGRDLNRVLRDDDRMAGMLYKAQLIPSEQYYRGMTSQEKAAVVGIIRTSYLEQYGRTITDKRISNNNDRAVALAEMGMPLDLTFGEEPLMPGNEFYIEPYTYNRAKYYKYKRGYNARNVTIREETKKTENGREYVEKTAEGIDANRSFGTGLVQSDLTTVRLNNSRNIADEIMYDPSYELFRKKRLRERLEVEYEATSTEAKARATLEEQKKALKGKIKYEVASIKASLDDDIKARLREIDDRVRDFESSLVRYGASDIDKLVEAERGRLLNELHDRFQRSVVVMRKNQLDALAKFQAEQTAQLAKDQYIYLKIKESDDRLEAAKRTALMTRELSISSSIRELMLAVEEGKLAKQAIVASRLFSLATGTQAKIQYRSISDPVGLITVQNALIMVGVSPDKASEIVGDKRVQAIYNFYDRPDKALTAWLLSESLDPAKFAKMKELPVALRPLRFMFENRVPIMVDDPINGGGFLGRTLTPHKTLMVNAKNAKGIFTDNFGVYHMVDRFATLEHNGDYLFDIMGLTPAQAFTGLNDPNNYLVRMRGFLRNLADNQHLIADANFIAGLPADLLLMAEKAKILQRVNDFYEIVVDIEKGKEIIKLTSFLNELDTFFDGGAKDLIVSFTQHGVKEEELFDFLKKLNQKGIGKQLNQSFISPIEQYQRFANWVNEFYLKNFVFNENLQRIPVIGRAIRFGQGALRNIGVSEELGLIAAINQFSIWEEARQARYLLRDLRFVNQLRDQLYRDQFTQQIAGNRFMQRIYGRYFNTATGELVGNRIGFAFARQLNFAMLRAFTILQPLLVATGTIAISFLSSAGFKLFINFIQFKFAKGFREAMDELKRLFKVIMYVFVYPLTCCFAGCAIVVVVLIVIIVSNVNPWIIEGAVWVAETAPGFFGWLLDFLLGIILRPPGIYVP